MKFSESFQFSTKDCFPGGREEEGIGGQEQDPGRLMRSVVVSVVSKLRVFRFHFR